MDSVRTPPPRDEKVILAQALCFQFDGFEVRPGAFTVSSSAGPLPLEPKSIRVLIHLIENRHRAVSKEELLRVAWDGAAVTDNAITRVIAQLRRELSDDARQPRYIQTLPTLGYRFVADVRVVPSRLEPVAARRAVRWSWVAACAAVLLLIGGTLWLGVGRSGAATTIPSKAHLQLTTSPGLDLSPNFSPDGNSIVYSSDSTGRFEIYSRSVGSLGGEVQITSDGSQNIQPAWSPDGQQIAYHSVARGGIWIMPAQGGESRQLVSSGSQPAWSPDGRRIAFRSENVFSISSNDLLMSPGRQSIHTVDVATGKTTEVAPKSQAGRQGFPSWSPDGTRVLFSVLNGNSGALWTAAPDGTARRQLCEAQRNVFLAPVFSAAGDAIYYAAISKTRDMGIWMVRLNARRDAVDGDPVELARTGTAIPRDLAVSRDGKRLAYTASTWSSTLWTLGVDAAGDPTPAPPRALYNHVVFRTSVPVFSPDGQRIAFFARVFGGGGDIWVMNADGSGAAPVTAGRFPDLMPNWSPDGQSLLFTRATDDGPTLWQISLGDRSEKPLLNGRTLLGWPRLSPDGKTLAYHSSKEQVMNIWTTDIAAQTARQLTFDREGVGYPAWSPDGKSIAYEVLRGENSYLAVMDRDGSNQMQLNKDPGHSWVFHWSPDSRRLLFAGFREGSWNLWWFDRQSGKQKKLTSETTLASYVRYPIWSPRGNKIVYEHSLTRGNIYTMELR